MREQVVGMFLGERNAGEAAQLLHGAGYASSDLDLVSKESLDDPTLASMLTHVQLGRLLARPEAMWRYALRWALIGSLVVEVPVLIWVLMACWLPRAEAGQRLRLPPPRRRPQSPRRRRPLPHRRPPIHQRPLLRPTVST